MAYKYELHCHTGAVSRCASVSPEKLLDIYVKNGYDGLVITEHYSPMTFRRHLLSPSAHTDFFLSSYYSLKEACPDGFTVLLGMELRHHATINDYLVYGITPEWLSAQKNLLMLNEKRAYELLHAEGFLVCQAHPFRTFIRRCDPAFIDGIEIYNGHTGDECNRKAYELWEGSGKIAVSGTDFHYENRDIPSGGMITEKRIENNEDLLTVLRSGEYELLMK